jgi:hypothetical protein
VVAAFRRPGMRLPMTLALAVVAECYLACLAVTALITTALWLFVVGPAVNGMFGHHPACTFAAAVLCGLVAVPLLIAVVRLMYCLAGRML